jgi:uncharacterized surface protein with fasciclin (FAS1) repeats
LVHVLSNSVLHVEAGTVIKGRNTGAAAIEKGGLVITRGAQLFAEGTPQNPIIFTAEQDEVADPEDLGIYQRGLWGGVILMGRASLNATVDATGNAASPKYELYEGLPDIEVDGQRVHYFGGSDDDDSSGMLRYVSIRHGGTTIEQNREINGLSLCAVGRGTVIEFVESYATADDGFEFFGGTVNTRYLVSAFNDDDSFDADQGHRGQHQFWFAVQPPDKRNYGFELNGEPSGLTGAEPREPAARFTVYNATLIGAGVGSSGSGGANTAFLIREFAGPRLYNSVFTDLAARGVELGPKGDYGLTNGWTELANNLWYGFTANGGLNNELTNICVSPLTQVLFTNVALSNLVVDPLLIGISRTNDAGLDPRPQPTSPALNPANVRATPADGFYELSNYQGAFGAYNWAVDWTALGAYEVLSASGGRNPVVRPAQPLPDLATLLASRPDLSTLVVAVQAAGLSDALRGPGPLTVFAPNNAAFAALGQSTIDDLLADTNQLAAVLTYHAVAAQLPSGDLQTQQYVTLLGEPLAVTLTNGTVRVNEATVIEADLLANNGVAHIIDAVLLPPGPQPPELLVGVQSNRVDITFATQSGRTYQLQATSALLQSMADWSNVGPALTGNGQEATLSDPFDTATNRYYRLQVR